LFDYSYISELRKKDYILKNFICSNCGYSDYKTSIDEVVSNVVGGVTKSVFGSVQIIIWLILFIACLCFPPVGWFFAFFLLLYPILSSLKNKSNVCPKCGADNCLIPLNTPKGKKLFKEYYPEEYVSRNDLSQEDKEYMEFRDKYGIKDE
jgi:ribosomal protein S27AE